MLFLLRILKKQPMSADYFKFKQYLLYFDQFKEIQITYLKQNRYINFKKMQIHKIKINKLLSKIIKIKKTKVNYYSFIHLKIQEVTLSSKIMKIKCSSEI